MYFEIENTPESQKRARKALSAPSETPIEECPRLVLAPFSRPPQVIFDKIPIGSTVCKELEILNPSKNIQQITLNHTLPPGLHIDLSEKWLELEPQTCYSLMLQWTPPQAMALRDTLHFINENRRSFDVILILKTLTLQKKSKGKAVKPSPRKITKRPALKKSPLSSTNKRMPSNVKGFKIKEVLETVQTSVKYKTVKSSYTAIAPNVYTDCSVESYDDRNPFDSTCVFFDTSEMFSNIKRTNLQTTYNKENEIDQLDSNIDNILKPSNKQNTSNSDIFDNIKFTPLRSVKALKEENVNLIPKVLLTLESSNESLNISDKENREFKVPEPDYIKRQAMGTLTPFNVKNYETHMQNKKLPNTSSPKELDNVNFTMNTDYSHISNDLSFYPQRFSTEKKSSTKLIYNVDDNNPNPIFGSDTFTKMDSPSNAYMSMDYHMANHPIEMNNPKSRQSLFREFNTRNDKYQGNIDKALENLWTLNVSPRKSMSPLPLQAIAEESSQYCDNRDDISNKPMTTFTVNRTFNKTMDLSFASKKVTPKDGWSKKSVKCEPELWKIPVAPLRRDASKKRDTFNIKRDSTTTLNISDHNSIMSVTIPTGNVYSQSLTIDPFSSTTYFYDEQAVHKFESEFKRWLNYILTPPAELDSNIEHKVDFGKAWIENRNKEVPAAPTKEQVSCKYHNNNRLDALRKSARNLLKSPEVLEVVGKVNAQIEKKLISIRSDKNLHLDVGLQKIIMELLLCYNPLWLRIGLEAIYSLVIPLKSNSDIEGLSTFIIQRMFRNPYLKNKNTKSNIPNMLLPAYLEAIKKFTLKKFFILVLFLDRAKQKRLISHDPCLFCRNATYKESREILIRFTRELIAGIGDITRHLRPLGYVVCHKQSYLDEYKYAVHHIATDIRDGVRLAKVMEIILMKNGLMTQLRTPAISRLQKIHNVQIALNALKEADFVIAGDIAPHDIVEGHREKTLSLLWQIIHVFRAPLFQTAATVIQTWWRKKYDIIIAQRKREEEVLRRRRHAASVVQCWWRRIQYNRVVEMKTRQITAATIVIQKYIRMWICRSRLTKIKQSVLKVEAWWKNLMLMWTAKRTLAMLRHERLLIRNNSAVALQSYVKRWICVRRYKMITKKVIVIQSIIRSYLIRKKYMQLQKSAVLIQRKYRAHLYMKKEINKYREIRKNVICIQSYIRMYLARKQYLALKNSVKYIENRYKTLLDARKVRREFLNLKASVIIIQSLFRSRRVRLDYLKQREHIVCIQSYFRMWVKRKRYTQLKDAVTTVEKHYKSLILMRKVRKEFLLLKKSVTLIQALYRSRKSRAEYLRQRVSLIKIQNRVRANIAMKKDRENYLKMRHAAGVIQNHIRAYLTMKSIRQQYFKTRKAVTTIQKYYRHYIKIKKSVIFIQRKYRAYLMMKKEVENYRVTRDRIIFIQSYFRMLIIRKEYKQVKSAVNIIGVRYKSLIVMRKTRAEFNQLKKTVTFIQSVYRSNKVRAEYLRQRSLVIRIQNRVKANIAMKKEKDHYLKVRHAAGVIQNRVRAHLLMKSIRQQYSRKKDAAVTIQRYYRHYMKIKKSAIIIQRKYRAHMEMKREVDNYKLKRNKIIRIQSYFRMLIVRKQYIQKKAAVNVIEKHYVALLIMRKARSEYLHLKNAVVLVQATFKSKKAKLEYLRQRDVIIRIQRKFRANIAMNKARQEYLRKKHAARLIQNKLRAYLLMKTQRQQFIKIKQAAMVIQRYYKSYLYVRRRYLRLKSAVLTVQYKTKWLKLRERIRTKIQERKEQAAVVLQKYFRRYLAKCYYEKYRKNVIFVQQTWKNKLFVRYQRCDFIQKRHLTIKLQAVIRGYIVRKEFAKKRLEFEKIREENMRTWAATKIQAFYRGYCVRKRKSTDLRIVKLRKRWLEGALKSTQQTMSERNQEALDIIANFYDIEAVIRAFKSLELLTEVYPMLYENNADEVVSNVYMCMAVANRSVSSVEMLTSAAAVLANFARYPNTACLIYQRERIHTALKFMLRFCTKETHLACILCTYIWLFKKYDNIREDLTKYLRLPELHKTLESIKKDTERMVRMKTANQNRNKLYTPQPKRMNTSNANYSLRSNVNASLLPALEPDYGIVKANKPRYFQDPLKGIDCLYNAYKL